MPAFNRRGPMGEGPMTGRRMGHCTNYGSAMERNTETSRNIRSGNIPESEIRGSVFGLRGRGYGTGRNRQNRFRNSF